jgi:hypothetical protein
MEHTNWKYKVGLVLVIISTLIFAFLLIIPFLNTSDKNKIFISTVTIVISEALFWSGGLLLGRQLFDKYKSYLNPRNWFKTKK